ncbi:MAG: hypothetical protein LBR83_09160 [Clostridiales bacterium]|jgi:hypothetical protein|nr:hypothetical protein [Clostridiales bacterium]
MERIKEFSQGGQKFVYIDLSGTQTNDDVRRLTDEARERISQYSPESVLTITNAENIRIDTETKDILGQYLTANKPYVKHGAIIGIDGIKKFMVNTMLLVSNRKNFLIARSFDHAVELLLDYAGKQKE